MINKNYSYSCKNCGSNKLDSLNTEVELWCGLCGQRHEIVNNQLRFYKGVKKSVRESSSRDTLRKSKHQYR